MSKHKQHLPSTFQQRLSAAQKPQMEISSSLLDKMIDGLEFQSLLNYQYVGLKPIDEIRKSLKEISTIRKKPVVCYVGNLLKVHPMVSSAIEGVDDLPFNEMIRSVPASVKEIDIVLVTPGGLAQQVAKFVNVLRPRFEKVSFILLNQAMSAGTIFALSGDEIIMGKESYIGPIDPQVKNNSGAFVPFQSLNTLIEDIRLRGEEQIKKKEPISWTDIQILNSIDKKDIGNMINASDYSTKMAEEYLTKYKFRSWINRSDGSPVTPQYREKRASEIASHLCRHSEWKSHGHGITREVAYEVCKLQTTKAEDVGIEREMRRMWALFFWLFENVPVMKYFISESYSLVKSVPNEKPKT